ncbi:MAG TPA: DNA mismatch repair protein MutS [Anaeromyxobacteraceae bacterium]|nr:DNA mismatch repair protein MutS [Anaeromyxobacteraceae bacterium]
MTDPRAAITTRLAEHRAAAARLDRSDSRVASLRLALFAAAAAIAVAAFALGRVSAAWLLAPAGAYAALAVHHDRILRRRELARRAIAFHEAAIARIDDRWAGRGTRGDRFLSEDHPYAADLDLFGEASLFELLCTARTRPGEDTLAAWLLGPATLDEVRARQRAVAELARRLDFREEMAIRGEDVRAEVDPKSIAAWAEDAPRLVAPGLRAAAAVAALVATGTLVGWFAGLLHPAAFVLGAFAMWGLSRTVKPGVEHALAGVERPGRELAVLSQLLALVERERFSDERLVEIQRALLAGSLPGSRALASLARRIAFAEWARNQLFAPVAFLLGWRIQWALSVEAWRAAHGAELRRWIGALGALEALSALGTYRFEHPEDPFPELADGAPVLEAEAMGHPLVAAARCVRNDLRLGPGQRLLVVSGSNMSGKSTFLRSAGTNVVLALAGAPVRAQRMRVSRLHVGATLRIQDSLQGGKSRFYAEIERLKQLSDMASGPTPLLFLVDEVLHGTNSHDRRIGAEAVLRGLLARGAIGLATTHDLALTESAAAIPEASNAHFEDQVVDGRITFDYRLRPGVVARSNALALMRAVGLEV